jgi:succinate dehydrogenase/fumarate reductase-like Fe-S protein
VVAKSFQEIRVPVKRDVPARDTRKSQAYEYNVRCTRNLILLSLIEAIKNDVYQQQNYNDSCKIKYLKD